MVPNPSEKGESLQKSLQSIELYMTLALLPCKKSLQNIELYMTVALLPCKKPAKYRVVHDVSTVTM